MKKYRDDELHGDDICFDVETNLNKVIQTSLLYSCFDCCKMDLQNAWLLYFSAAFLLVSGIVMLQICRSSLAQRLDGIWDIKRARGGLPPEKRSVEEFLFGSEGLLRKTSMSSTCSDQTRNMKRCHNDYDTGVSGKTSVHSEIAHIDGEDFSSTAFSPLLSRPNLVSRPEVDITNLLQGDSDKSVIVTRYTLVLTHAMSLFCKLGLVRCEIVCDDSNAIYFY